MKALGLLALALGGLVVALLAFSVVGQALDGYREPSYGRTWPPLRLSATPCGPSWGG